MVEEGVWVEGGVGVEEVVGVEEGETRQNIETVSLPTLP